MPIGNTGLSAMTGMAGIGGGLLPIEGILDNIQIYGDVKAGDKEIGGSGGLNGIRWGQKSYTEYVQPDDDKRLLWIPDFGDGIPAWKCDGIDNFWKTEVTVTESTYVEWFLILVGTNENVIPQESGPSATANDGRHMVLDGRVGSEDVILRVQRDGVLSSRVALAVAAVFDGNWVLIRRELAAPGNNSDNIAFLNNVSMSLTEIDNNNPGTGSETFINYLGMREGLTFPFNGHFRVHLFASPIPSAGQIAATEAQINLEYGVYSP